MEGSEGRLKPLLVRGMAGDARAYAEFLHELGGLARGFVRRRLARLPDDAEDLVQEILLAVHNQRHTFDPAQPLTPWVHAIARYKLVDFLRARSRTDALNDPLDDESELFASADHDAAEARRDLAKLLDTLPERQRLPIVYTKLDGLSVGEAAARIGCSESVVKVTVHRGLRALAARIRGGAKGEA